MEALSSQDGSEVFGEEQRQEKTDERNNPELGKEEITSYGKLHFNSALLSELLFRSVIFRLS